MSTVVVTGAGRGIGAAITDRLCAGGLRVVGLDLEFEWADADDRRAVRADVAAAGAFDDLDAWIGPGDDLVGWVNNAAVALPAALHVAEAPATAKTFAVNLEAYFWGCRAAVRRFLRQRTAGAIVNVSSIQGSHAFPGWAAYVTAKGGVDALTRYVAVEYGAAGVRCNAVAPGNVRTPLSDAVVDDAPEPDAMSRVMTDLAPMLRMAEPPEIARTVAFLLSDDSSFVNGHVLVVDGGATARCYPMPTTEYG